MEFFKYKNDDQRQKTNLLIIKLGENKTITFGDYRLFEQNAAISIQIDEVNRVICAKKESGFKSDGFFNVKSWNFGAPIFKKIKEEYIYIKNCKYIHGETQELIKRSNFSWEDHEKFRNLIYSKSPYDKFIGIISKKRGFIWIYNV